MPSLWHLRSILLESEFHQSLLPVLCPSLHWGLHCPVAEICLPPSLHPSLCLPSWLLRKRISQQVDKRQNISHFYKTWSLHRAWPGVLYGLGAVTGGSRTVHYSKHFQSSRQGPPLVLREGGKPLDPCLVPPGGHQGLEQVASESFGLCEPACGSPGKAKCLQRLGQPSLAAGYVGLSLSFSAPNICSGRNKSAQSHETEAVQRPCVH